MTELHRPQFAAAVLYPIVIIAALAAAGLSVHSPSGRAADETAASKKDVEIIRDPNRLPSTVRSMRDALLDAAYSGDLENLRTVMESNELKPVFSYGNDTDAIAYWKQISGDGEGRDVLAALTEVLEMGFVRLEPGTPNELYVWPYLHVLDPKTLSPEQEVELLRLVPAKELEAMRQSGSYLYYRVGIGPDGTWHYFVRGD